MTTTLRPLSPEERLKDGGRARHFAVCVNSRPVGQVHLSTDAGFGPHAGRIVKLYIDPADRRRGRGTVAALAAEEVLRGWGCARVAVTVPGPGDADPAHRLVTALGYTERHSVLAASPTGRPELAEGSADRPMTEEEFSSWQGRRVVSFAAALVRAGVPEATADSWSRESRRGLLPKGPGAPQQLTRVLEHRGEPVGDLWVSLRTPEGRDEGYVCDIEVRAGHCRRGHGRTLMRVAERLVRDAGATVLSLNVFADNAPALRLYASLGYRPTSRTYAKPLL